MRQRHVGLAILIAFLCQPLAAETVKGRAAPETEVTFAFVPGLSGQALVTLSWSRKSASLFMVMDCFDDLGVIPWGTSASLQDRLQRMDVGVLVGLECVITVSSFEGTSRFALTLQVADDENLSERTPAAVPPATRSAAALFQVDPARFPGLGGSVDRVRATYELLRAGSQYR